jgi:biopolymer transport protein ExbB/TolQ
MNNSTNPGQAPRGGRQAGKPAGVMGWVNHLLSRREIYNRVEEDFPTWDEYSKKKLDDAQEKDKPLIDLPPHRVYISSPLQWNFMFFLVVIGSLVMGYAQPEWAPFFVYGAIVVIFVVALLFIARDGIFFHFEGHRLERDCEMINKNSDGPTPLDDSSSERGFWRSLVRRKKSVFRSTLLQIHYQNVLRTFQQGNRRARVDQDSSIMDLHTLLTQRGMKLVWTFIEVLPQLGLLGTLIGLARMFFAFSLDSVLPEVAIISGFGTALGTTILANLFVLILRPLFMRNERAMFEIISALQMLMATFILPTQNYVLGTLGTSEFQGFTPGPSVLPAAGGNSSRLARSMDDLTHTLDGLAKAQRRQLSGGETSKESLQIAEDMRATMESIKNSEPVQVNFSNQALAKLTETMQDLSKKIDGVGGRPGNGGDPPGKIGHELMQLRMLNHDTLILMDQLASQLEHMGQGRSNLLSQNKTARTQAFPEYGTTGDSIAELPDGESSRKSGKPGKGSRGLGRRLFSGR